MPIPPNFSVNAMLYNPAITQDPEAKSDNPKKRKGYTYIRLTASSLNTDDEGNPIRSNSFSLGNFAILQNNGNPYSGFINISFLSGEIVRATNGEYFYRTGASNTTNWIEWCYPDDENAGPINPASYVIVVAPEEAGDSRILYQWKLESLGEHDNSWQLLDRKSVSGDGVFLNTISNATIPINLDPFGVTPPTPGFTAQTDYTGKLPDKPMRLRLTSVDVNVITVKWTASQDKRQTTFRIFRRDVDAGGEFEMVAQAAATVTVDGSGTQHIRNQTGITDTVPNTNGNHKYQYKVVAVNSIGTGSESDVVDVTTLTPDEVFVANVYTKIVNGQLITLDEAASYLVSSRSEGSTVASLIANNAGGYSKFLSMGYNKTISLQLAMLGLMQSDADAMLNQQFNSTTAILNSNATVAAAFMAEFYPGAANSQVPLTITDVLPAFNTPAERRRLIAWMTANGHLQT
ncbi:hypothetical protein CCP3SC1_1720004 [Gammaproteobacteria bacterium]